MPELKLSNGTKPKGLKVVINGFGPGGDKIYIGKYEISIADALVMTANIFTGTTMRKKDLRPQFLYYLQSMRMVKSKKFHSARLVPTFPLSNVTGKPSTRKEAQNAEKSRIH